MGRRPLLPLLALTVLLALPPASEALSCYQCEGLTLQSSAPSDIAGMAPLRKANASETVGYSYYSCAGFDPSQSKYKMRCVAPYDRSCGKNVNSNGETYERGCANGVGHTCTTYNGGVTQCLCTSDFCNSARSAAPALLLLLPAVLLAVLSSGQ